MILSIIIPVKNDAANLQACLQSIKDAHTHGIDYEIIVIDNGSDDNTLAVAQQYTSNTRVVPDATVAALRNIGAEKSSGTLLAFLDSDCTVSENWFKQIDHYSQDDTTICFGSPPDIPASATWVQRCWYQIRRKGSAEDGAFPIEWLESMNLFVRRSAFNAIGGFDESMVTCEDYDLCMRLKSHGAIVCDSSIVAIHHGEAATPLHFYQKERWRGISNVQSFRKHGYNLAELPSLLFPLVQLILVAVASLTLALSLGGVFPLTWWIAGVVVWQAPLLLLAFRKKDHDAGMQQAIGISLLVNIYLVARGISLFTGASWANQTAVKTA